MSGTKSILKNRKGFTLIELLIVILILSLIAAVVIPIYTSRNEQARKTANSSTIAAIESAADSYDLDVGLAAADYIPISASSVLYAKGYLKTVPANPWKGTSETQGGDSWGYVLVKFKPTQSFATSPVSTSNKVFLGSLGATGGTRTLTYYDPTGTTEATKIKTLTAVTVMDDLTGAADHQYFVAP